MAANLFLSSSASRRLLAAAIRAQRQHGLFSTAAKRTSGEVHPVYFKLKEVQKEFQTDNGLRIHERHGALGKVVYMITLALIVVGGIDCGLFLYKMIYPPKPAA